MLTGRMIFILGALALLATVAQADEKPEHSWWQRDKVRACCSLGDAVWADVWEMLPDGRIRATVTGGGPQNHEWAPVGREYVVEPLKHLDEPGNPTGRPMLFLNPRDLDRVFCFALGPMI